MEKRCLSGKTNLSFCVQQIFGMKKKNQIIAFGVTSKSIRWGLSFLVECCNQPSVEYFVNFSSSSTLNSVHVLHK